MTFEDVVRRSHIYTVVEKVREKTEMRQQAINIHLIVMWVFWFYDIFILFYELVKRVCLDGTFGFYRLRFPPNNFWIRAVVFHHISVYVLKYSCLCRTGRYTYYKMFLLERGIYLIEVEVWRTEILKES